MPSVCMIPQAPPDAYDLYNSDYIARGLLATRHGHDHSIVEYLVNTIGDVDVTIHASLSLMCSDAIIRVLDVKSHIKCAEDIWAQVDDECVYKWGITPVTLMVCFDGDYRLHIYVCDDYMVCDIVLFYTHVVFGEAIGAAWDDVGFINYNHAGLTMIIKQRLSSLTNLSHDNKTVSILRSLATRYDRSHRATCPLEGGCRVCIEPLLDIIIQHELNNYNAL